MKRSIEYVAATFVGMAAAFFPISYARAEPTWRQIMNGEAGNNIIDFSVPNGDVTRLRNMGFSVSQYDNRNVISRFSDPTFLRCANNAGLPIIARAAAALVGGHLPSAGGAGLDAAVDGTLTASEVKSYGECEQDWLNRISAARTGYQFQVIDVRLAEIDSLNSNTVGDILNLQNRTTDINFRLSTLAGQTQIKIKNLQQALDQLGATSLQQFAALSRQIQDAQKQLAAITDAQERQRAAEALRIKTEENRRLVHGSAAALSLVAKMAFASDPVAVARIETGISSIAKITDSLLTLSSGSAIDLGSKLLLSTNIAGGTLALISMFGPQNSETALLQRQLTSIHKELTTLRREMHERFDRLENIIIQAVKYIDQRLESIERRLERIEKHLERIANTVNDLYGLSLAGFQFLITEDFTERMRGCGQEVSRRIFSAENAKACIDIASRYGREGAHSYAIISGARYGTNMNLDAGAALIKELPPSERVIYLDALLRNAAKGNLVKYPLPGRELISPPDWVDAVDSFAKIVSNPGQFKGLRDAGITRAQLVSNTNYGPQIGDLIRVGELAKMSVAQTRKSGVEYSLSRLKEKIENLSDLVATDLVKHLSNKDLGILAEGRTNHLYAVLRGPNDEPWAAGGNMRYSIRYYSEYLYEVVEGPEKQRVWKSKRRLTRFEPRNELMPGGRESDIELAWTQLLRNNWEAVRPGFNVEYDRDIMAYQDYLYEVNLPYLEGAGFDTYTSKGRAAVLQAFTEVRKLTVIEAACDEITKAREVVEAYANLIRTSYSESDDNWRTSLRQLPDNSKAYCDAILAPNMSESLFKPYPGMTLKRAIGLRAGHFENLIGAAYAAFLSTDQTGGMDIIDARIKGLRGFLPRHVANQPRR